MVASNNRRAADEDTRSHLSFQLDDEALVAYLDGELTSDQVATVESGLQTSGELRDRLGQLKQAWEMLEELPENKPSPKFSQSTMEMIALSEDRDSTSGKYRLELLRNLGILAATCLSVAFIAYIATRQFQRGENGQALNDLPILADWNAFRLIDSFEWLEKLEGVEDLQTVAFSTPNSSDPPKASGLGIDAVPLTEANRREWVEELSEIERGQLIANRAEFSIQHPPVRERLRAIANLVYKSPESAERYLKVARSYQRVLEELSGIEIAQLADATIDDRLKTLTRIVNQKTVYVFGSDLPDEDRKAISDWLRNMEDVYDSELPTVQQGPSGSQRLGARVMRDLDRRRFENLSVISDDDFEPLKLALSARAQKILSQLGDDERVYDALYIWLEVVVPRPSKGQDVRL